jgi:hypothetical protein
VIVRAENVVPSIRPTPPPAATRARSQALRFGDLGDVSPIAVLVADLPLPRGLRRSGAPGIHSRPRPEDCAGR